MNVKVVPKIAGILLLPLLAVYAVLAYFVFFRLPPRIAAEERRQEGWRQAIKAAQEECRAATRRINDAQAKHAQRLEGLRQQVVDGERRISLQRKSLAGYTGEEESARREKLTAELEKAREALAAADRFKVDERSVGELAQARQRLDGLRERAQLLTKLRERREALMVWPLSEVERWTNSRRMRHAAEED